MLVACDLCQRVFSKVLDFHGRVSLAHCVVHFDQHFHHPVLVVYGVAPGVVRGCVVHLHAEMTTKKHHHAVADAA